VELDRNHLRRTAEFATAALSATTSRDVAGLVRRVRHVLDGDEVHLWSMAAEGVVEWHDPEDRPTPLVDVAARRDDRSLSISETTTAFTVVHLVVRRRHHPFRAPDRAVLSLLSPYLLAAVAAVDLHAAAGSNGPGTPLTSRESQILASIAGGATNKEVASDLDISPRTVQKHLEHIYGKLGLHRRTAAAGWWSEHLAAG